MGKIYFFKIKDSRKAVAMYLNAEPATKLFKLFSIKSVFTPFSAGMLSNDLTPMSFEQLTELNGCDVKASSPYVLKGSIRHRYA